MSITITFNDYEEMEAFARKMLGDAPMADKTEVVPAVSVQAIPAPHPAPEVPVASQTTTVTAPAEQSALVVQPAPAAASTPVAPVQIPQAVHTTSRTYTPDELAKAAMQLMDSGRQSDLIGLLSQFGVDSLPSLRPDQYGAFATALRGMGAQI